MTENNEQFSTGAMRELSGSRMRPDLVSPFAMQRLGEHLAKGAKKYVERNWEKGIPISRCVESLYRHLLKYQMGERDEDHIAAILCNAMFVAHIEEMVKRGVLPNELLDLPDYSQRE